MWQPPDIIATLMAVGVMTILIWDAYTSTALQPELYDAAGVIIGALSGYMLGRNTKE